MSLSELRTQAESLLEYFKNTIDQISYRDELLIRNVNSAYEEEGLINIPQTPLETLVLSYDELKDRLYEIEQIKMRLEGGKCA